jgi:hypothetical protein
MTTDVLSAAASPLAAMSRTISWDAGPVPREGRHRRVYCDLVVHLVFDDLSEMSLGPDSAIGRSLGHLASWLIER